LLINIGIYLENEELLRESRLSGLVREFVKTGIRCFLYLPEPVDTFAKLDAQYAVIRDEQQGISLTDIREKEFIAREIEFCCKNKIDLILTDIPSILNKEQEFNLPVIDLKQELRKRDSCKECAGRTLKKLFEHYSLSDRYVVIDVGTNNVLLVWAVIINGEIKVIHRASRISAMGKNMRDGKLTKAGIERVKKILSDFMRLSEYFSRDIIVLGTSCSRESDNINLVSDWLKSRYDIEYRIISDEEEASLMGRANRNHFQEYRELILFDIGGGSTEFIYYQGDKAVYQDSLRLGIRRLENLSNDKRVNRIDYINKRLDQLPAGLLRDPALVGIGGTVTNISAVKKGLIYYDSAEVHKSSLSRNDIEYYFNKFSSMELLDIAELMPFEPLRANVITTGLLIVRAIMDYFNQDIIYVSDFGIQFGILEQITTAKTKGRIFP